MKGKQQPVVWFTNTRPQMLFGFTCELDGEPGLFGARVNEFRSGRPLERDQLPTKMWVAKEFASDDHRQLPPISSAGGFLVVSKVVADTLASFDLGSSRFHAVELFKSDRQQPFPGSHMFLQICEVRRYFSLEHSTRFEALPHSQTSYRAMPSIDTRNDDITVVAEALDGPDLWIDDALVSSFFLSDRLVQALRAAGLTNQLPLFRCLVVPLN